MDFDKTVINAAINALLENPSDCESAAIIIEFGSRLPDSDKLSYQSSITTRTNGGSVTGHTKEQGNVTVPHDDEETKEFSHGVYFERAGFYKIHRMGARIVFLNFWKADIITQGTSGLPTEYSVLYDPKTLEFKDFAEKIEKPLRSLRLFGFFIHVSKWFWKSFRTSQETYAGHSIRITKHISQ